MTFKLPKAPHGFTLIEVIVALVLIGLTGATGRVSGPHLHWGVKINGIAVNPLGFVEVINSLAR